MRVKQESANTKVEAMQLCQILKQKWNYNMRKNQSQSLLLDVQHLKSYSVFDDLFCF